MALQKSELMSCLSIHPSGSKYPCFSYTSFLLPWLCIDDGTDIDQFVVLLFMHTIWEKDAESKEITNKSTDIQQNKLYFGILKHGLSKKTVLHESSDK